MARVDQNSGYVAMAVTDNAALTPTALLVSPVTGRMECVIAATPGAALPATRIRIDENSFEGITAVTDDANATIVPLLCDSNGYLLCDVIFE